MSLDINFIRNALRETMHLLKAMQCDILSVDLCVLVDGDAKRGMLVK